MIRWRIHVARPRFSQKLSAILLMIATAFHTGCSDDLRSHVRDTSDESAEILRPPNERTSLEHFGDAEAVEPGGILRRGVAVPTESGEVVFDDAIATKGPTGFAWQDPETGKMAWRAHTCTNAQCQGSLDAKRPFVFVHEIPGAVVDERGTIQKASVPIQAFVPKCPACGRVDSVQEFVHPDVAKRQAELDAELKLARRIYRARQPYPAGVRPPLEIMRERALLPRVYLLAP